MELTASALSTLALSEIMNMLGLSHLSEVNRRIRHVYQFGLHGIDGPLTLADLLHRFFLEELKRDERAYKAFNLYCMKLLSDRVDLLDSSSISDALDQALRSNPIVHSLVSVPEDLSSIKGEVSIIRRYMDDLRNSQRSDREQFEHARNTLISSLEEIIRGNTGAPPDLSSDLARIHSLLQNSSNTIDASIGRKLVIDSRKLTATLEQRRAAIGSTPSWSLVAGKRFMRRDSVLNSASNALRHWLAREVDHAIPIFWVDGRYGDGKSVFLLQLAEALLLEEPSAQLFIVNLDRLDDWLLWAGKQDDAQAPPIAVVDDLTSIADFEKFERSIDHALRISTIKGRIVTSSTTADQAAFLARLPQQFDITPFKLPPLDTRERDALSIWLGAQCVAPATQDPPRFVEIAFEIVNGPLQKFVANFWKRTSIAGLAEPVSALLALNAIGLVATETQLAPDRLRASLARWLAADNVSSVSTSPTGRRVRGFKLFHSRLAWALLLGRNAEQSPAGAWAQAFVHLLDRATETEDPSFPCSVLKSLSQLAEVIGLASSPAGLFRDVLRELMSTLKENDPRHLLLCAALHRLPNDVLADFSTRIEQTISASFAKAASARLSCWNAVSNLLRISSAASSRDLPVSLTVLETSIRVLARRDYVPTSFSALHTLASQSSQLSSSIVALFKKLEPDFLGHASAGSIITALVTRKETNDWSMELAEKWLMLYARDTAASVLLPPFLARSGHLDKSIRFASEWLRANQRDKRFTIVLEATLASVKREQVENKHPHIRQLRSFYIRWTDGSPNLLAGSRILFSLLKFFPHDRALLECARKTIKCTGADRRAGAILSDATLYLSVDDLTDPIIAFLDQHPGDSSASSLLSWLIDSRRDADATRIFGRMLDSGLADSTLSVCVDGLLARSPSKLTYELASLWIERCAPCSSTYTILLCLASIPAAAPRTSTVIESLFGRIGKARERTWLIWQLVRNERFVRSAWLPLARTITKYFDGDNLSSLALYFIRCLKDVPEAPAHLVTGLCEHRPEFTQLPVLLTEALSLAPNNFKLRETAVRWLQARRATPDTINIAKLLANDIRAALEQRSEASKEQSRTTIEFSSRVRLIIDELWKWCFAFGDTPGIPHLISVLLRTLWPHYEGSTSNTLRWASVHGSNGGAPFVLVELLDVSVPKLLDLSPHQANPLFNEMLLCIEVWLRDQAEHPGAGFLISSLMRIPRDFTVYKGRRLAFNLQRKLSLVETWSLAKKSARHAEVTFLALLQTSGIRRHIGGIVKDWIIRADTEELSGSFPRGVLWILKEIAPDGKQTIHDEDERLSFGSELIQIVSVWLENHYRHGESGLVLAFLQRVDRKTAKSTALALIESGSISRGLLTGLRIVIPNTFLAVIESYIEYADTEHLIPEVLPELVRSTKNLQILRRAQEWMLSHPQDPLSIELHWDLLGRTEISTIEHIALPGLLLELDDPRGTTTLLSLLRRRPSKSSRVPVQHADDAVGEDDDDYEYPDGNEDVSSIQHNPPTSPDAAPFAALTRKLRDYIVRSFQILNSVPEALRDPTEALECAIIIDTIGISVSDLLPNVGPIVDYVRHDPEAADLFEAIARWPSATSDLLSSTCSWFLRFKKERATSYVISALVECHPGNPEIFSLVGDYVAENSDDFRASIVVEALIKTWHHDESVPITSRWLSFEGTLTNLSYVIEAIADLDHYPSAKSLLALSLQRGEIDAGSLGALAKCVLRFGLTDQLEYRLQQACRTKYVAVQSAGYQLSRWISSHGWDRELIILVASVLNLIETHSLPSASERLGHFLARECTFVLALAHYLDRSSSILALVEGLLSHSQSDRQSFGLVFRVLRMKEYARTRSILLPRFASVAWHYPEYRDLIVTRLYKYRGSQLAALAMSEICATGIDLKLLIPISDKFFDAYGESAALPYLKRLRRKVMSHSALEPPADQPILIDGVP
ncbi:hypothetical protein LOC51_20990 [Rubrivivax sp. JA1024]|nr:hypothetical protein [Rubrivivax sp. JA1024]